MGKCGCAGDRCNCLITSGNNIAISGTGTTENPYRLDVVGVEVALSVEDTATLDLTLEGEGNAESPYILRGDVIGGPGGGGIAPVLTEFFTDGTWTKPAGAKMVQIICVGGGGGGGGGLTAQYAQGGMGGAPGDYTVTTWPASALPATAPVDIGPGGGGGAGASDTTQNAGADGVLTTFGSGTWRASAKGGRGGWHPANPFWMQDFYAIVIDRYGIGPGFGGDGGAMTNNAGQYSTGGGGIPSLGLAQGAGVAPGLPGGNAANHPVFRIGIGGDGGGGGDAGSSFFGGPGGRGAIGAGGGGGGAGRPGSSGGNGGNGGDGYVAVLSW